MKIKTKLLEKTILFLILIIITSLSVFAYNRLCLTHGQGTPPEDPRYVCEHDLCIVCVTEAGNPTLPQRCADIDGCNFLNGSGTDFIPPNITILSPQNDTTFDTIALLLDIETNELAKMYLKNNNNERRGFIQLTDFNTHYGRFRRFDEGHNSYTIKAIDKKGNTAYKTLEFNVDTKVPRIKEILPEDGTYVKGTSFTVEYDEENVENVTLHYGLNPNDNSIELFCPSGRNVLCGVSLDLEIFDGNVMFYYFTVADSINSVDSEINSVIVDSTAPVLEVISPQNTDYGIKKLPFTIELDNPVTELTYTDWGKRKPKPKRLCRNCISYNKGKSFKDGSHSITFTATDYAGNTANITRNFTTDSKAPKIKNTEPRNKRYTNGYFKVRYSEPNLDQVLLTIIDGSNFSTEYVYPVEDCPKGKNQECVAEVDLEFLHNKTIYYYFVLSDLFFSKTSKLIKDVTVDTVDPYFVSLSPEQGQVFDSKYIYLDVAVSETAEIIYSLDSAKERKICSKCSQKEKKLTIRGQGAHSVTITATDPAGNYVSETRNFEVYY